jgi:hypothetical protein
MTEQATQPIPQPRPMLASTGIAVILPAANLIAIIAVEEHA